MNADVNKNILFIFVDQWRGDCIGAFGHPDVHTPNLNALTDRSISFSRAYAAAPSCIPARACVATGQTPYSCGFIGYQDGVVWDYPSTLMTRLRDNGYQTINVGKTHFYPQRAHLGFEINDIYDPIKNLSKHEFVSDYEQWLQKESGGNVTDTASEFDANSLLYLPWMAEEHLHPTAWNANQAIHRLKHRDVTRPFFMQVGFHRPHPPYDPPYSFYDMYRDCDLEGQIPYGDWCEEFAATTNDISSWYGKNNKKTLDTMRKAYYASITYVDYYIGKIMQHLSQQGLLDDTLIIFTSDHGELLGDHYMYRKISPFEGSAKIPFIVKPTKDMDVITGATYDTPISHYDIMPTCLSYAGIDIPNEVEGSSILRLLKQQPFERDFIHGEHSGYGNNGWQYIMDNRYKYIWNTMSGKEYLFDINLDPNECVNLAVNSKYENIISSHRKKLIKILSTRPEHELVKDGKLSHGKILPSVRQDFLDNSNRQKNTNYLLQ